MPEVITWLTAIGLPPDPGALLITTAPSSHTTLPLTARFVPVHDTVRVCAAGKAPVGVKVPVAVVDTTVHTSPCPRGPAVLVPLAPGVPLVPLTPGEPAGPRGPAGQDAQLVLGFGVAVAVAFFVVGGQVVVLYPPRTTVAQQTNNRTNLLTAISPLFFSLV